MLKNHFKEWLNRPYSYREETSFQFSISFIIGFAVFFTMYILQPFGLGELDNNKLHYFLGYGAITTVIILLFFFLFAPIFPNYFSDKNWTVKKEVLTLSSVIFIIGSVTWVYHKMVAIGGNNLDKFTFLYFLKYTFSLGIFPVVLYVYLAEMLLANDRKTTVKKVKKNTKDKNKYKLSLKKKPKKITIYASNNKNAIVFNLNNLIFVTSEGNYATFYLKNELNNTVTEKILRVQLQVIQNTLQEHTQIMRCHKSYIVNTNYVNDISGNARAHFLHFTIIPNQIPVSRKFTKKELIELIA